jgi:bacterioferritin
MNNTKLTAANKPFLTTIQELRTRAREHISCGAVTEDYQGDLKRAHELLNGALATELVCVLRYRYHYFMAQGLPSESIKEEFMEHSREELEHADMIAERITQLGGKPELNPANFLARSASEYQEGQDLVAMIEENLVAERIAVEHYRELIEYFAAEKDPTTRRMFEKILGKEEEHAEEMSDLLTAVRGVSTERDGNRSIA